MTSKPLIDELVEALEAITDEYVSLGNSGDCGFWDPETIPQVIAARAALSRAKSMEE